MRLCGLAHYAGMSVAINMKRMISESEWVIGVWRRVKRVSKTGQPDQTQGKAVHKRVKRMS